MNFLFPFLAIISESVAKTIDKLNYTKHRISARQLMLLVFMGMSFSLTIFVVAARKPLPSFSMAAAGFILLITLISFAGNIFSYLSLKANDLSLREPVVDFQPILAGMVGYALFPQERKTSYLIVFILGALILYWGMHKIKLRRLQRKGLQYLMFCIGLEALLPTIYKWTLSYLSPEYITLLRVLFILVLSLIFFRRKKSQRYSSGKVMYGLSSGVVYAIGAVVSLYAIQRLGVVLTMLLLALGPALRYLAGHFILNEKVRRTEIMSSFLLVAVVLAGIYI